MDGKGKMMNLYEIVYQTGVCQYHTCVVEGITATEARNIADDQVDHYSNAQFQSIRILESVARLEHEKIVYLKDQEIERLTNIIDKIKRALKD